MAYDQDGTAGLLARAMQAEWAGAGISVELRPLSGAALENELLRGRAQLLLVEAPRLTGEPPGSLAGLAMPLRGPAVGTVRTGWRTREFDPWILPTSSAPTLDPAWAQRRIEEEGVVLPLARLPWIWVDRAGRGPVVVHGRHGVLPAHPLAPDPGAPQGR
jgi:hypothetical protein